MLSSSKPENHPFGLEILQPVHSNYHRVQTIPARNKSPYKINATETPWKYWNF